MPIGKNVPKALMYERVMEEMNETRAAIAASGRLFMYAENWVYAPAVTKIVEILNATKDKILFIKAEESHCGSHAAHAAHWDMTGGGTLIRMGCHPFSAVLYLKQVEARARAEKLTVSAVTAMSATSGTRYRRRITGTLWRARLMSKTGRDERDLLRRHQGHRFLRR